MAKKTKTEKAKFGIRVSELAALAKGKSGFESYAKKISGRLPPGMTVYVDPEFIEKLKGQSKANDNNVSRQPGPTVANKSEPAKS